MRSFFVFSTLTMLMGCLASVSWAGGEKVPLDKLPKPVVDTIKAKWPKGVLRHANLEKIDGKAVYEVGVNFDKTHLHAVVAADGKLLEIHRPLDPKDLPAKITKAVTTKYPQRNIEEAEEQTDASGKVIGYEVVILLNATRVFILLDADGTIRKETKETIKSEEQSSR